MPCEHGPHEDHLICRECGECSESLNEDDICAECREEVTQVSEYKCALCDTDMVMVNVEEYPPAGHIHCPNVESHTLGQVTTYIRAQLDSAIRERDSHDESSDNFDWWDDHAEGLGDTLFMLEHGRAKAPEGATI